MFCLWGASGYDTLKPMTLFDEAASYLRLAEPWSEVAEAMVAESGRDVSSAQIGVAPPIELAVDELVGTARTERLLSTIRPRVRAMSWRQNPTYTDAGFLGRYAYCELLGPAGLASHTTVSAGLLYLAPGTMYPPHAHPAEEAYHLLAGVSEWQSGSEPLTWRSPGDRVEHPSGVTHSMRSGSTPMLALYIWRGDLATPARFVPVPSAVG